MENDNSGDIEGPEGPVSPTNRPEPGMDVSAEDMAEAPQSRSRQQRKKPYTEAWMMADARKHHRDLAEAIDRFGPRLSQHKKAALSPKAKEAIRDLRRNQAHWSGYMNPFARVAVFQAIWRHAEPILGQAANPEMITIIHAPWHTNDKVLEFYPEVIQDMVKVRLAGLNAIVAVEFAYYHNVRHDEDGVIGRLFAPHVQGVVWGDSTRADRAALAASFAGGIGGSHGVERQAMTYPFGAVAYGVKAPMHGYSFYRRRDGSYAHRAKALPLSWHYRLWGRLHGFTWPQLVFGVGEGEIVLNAAWADLNDTWRRRTRHYGGNIERHPFSMNMGGRDEA
jgi:hypothetical protein